jgi:hypothetical protein
MLKKWADLYGVPLVTRTEPKIVETFHGERVEGAGWLYTFPVDWLYESHYTKETFEIGPMEDLSDILLLHWWIVKHGALSGVTKKIINSSLRHNTAINMAQWQLYLCFQLNMMNLF